MLQQFKHSIMAVSMPTWRRPVLDSERSGEAHRPSHCSESRDLTWTHRWPLGWRSSRFDSIRWAACPLEMFVQHPRRAQPQQQTGRWMENRSLRLRPQGKRPRQHQRAARREQCTQETAGSRTRPAMEKRTDAGRPFAT